MNNKSYFAYMLRLWRSGNPEKPAWHASLEDPHSREVTTFADLTALWHFLQLQLRSDEKDSSQPADLERQKPS